MKNLKKTFLLVALIATLAICFCFSASAEVTSGECGDNVVWTFDDKTGVLTISGEGDIYSYAWDTAPFGDMYNLNTVVIEEGVASIGEWAFAYCESLTDIALPDSVTSIGEGVFYDCSSLTGITIPEGVTSIEKSAFVNCTNLTSITMPDSVTSIGENAFLGCTSLVGVTLPEGVTSIGAQAFDGCESLSDIIIPEGVTSIENWTFHDCLNLTSIMLPEGLTSIGYAAFSNCESLTSITLPEGLTSMSDLAFWCCESLTSITIPKGVTSIGYAPFCSCLSLEDITVDADNLYFSSDESGVLFNKDKTVLLHYPIGNDREVYEIPDGVTEVAYYAFNQCHSLKYVGFPESLISIGEEAFDLCTGLTSVIIPKNVARIGVNAFDFCTCLTGFTVDTDNSYFSSVNGVLFNKGKTTVVVYPDGNDENSYTIPDGVVSVGEYSFRWSEYLTSITIPDGVKTIEYQGFANCYGLTSITIPESVTNIGDAAFWACDSLADVYYMGTEEQWNKITIGTDNECLLNADIHFHNHSDDNEDNLCDECGKTICEHEFLTETEEATCTVNGYSMTVCSICGYVENTEFFEATGHSMDNHSAKAPTCTEIGWGAYETCRNCTLSTYVELPSLGHSFGEWMITENATFITEGTETATCIRCPETKERKIPVKNVSETKADEVSGISVGYINGAFDGDVEVVVEESFDGTEFISLPLDDFRRVSSWNIEIYVNGEKAQPFEPVLVSIPLPEGYNSEKIAVFHIDAVSKTAERISPVVVEGGYIRFMASSFSVYTVVDESSENKGIFDFFNKLIEFIMEVIFGLFKFDC